MLTTDRMIVPERRVFGEVEMVATLMPPGYSRHYYDLRKLEGSLVREAALGGLTLLQKGRINSVNS